MHAESGQDLVPEKMQNIKRPSHAAWAGRMAKLLGVFRFPQLACSGKATLIKPTG